MTGKKIKYTLRRVIPNEECPGTCCQLTGIFPGSGNVMTKTTKCIYFEEYIPGRKYGGCPFFKPDGTIDQEKYDKLSNEDQEKFQFSCNKWPCPNTVPELDTPYDEDFGQGFGDICPCFRWEVENDGE